MFTFAPTNNKNSEQMIQQNLINAIIIIRLQGAAGSDKAYI